MARLPYLLFFCSGLSGLVYQVVWVRVFGNVFGNTIYSASLIVAVFMLGLGAGSYLVGAWADRRYAELTRDRPGRPPSKARLPAASLLRAYGYVEIAIGLLGFGVATILSRLDQVSALASSYTREPGGWYSLSTGSLLARAGIAVALLTPITLLMGGTLTLLIRHLVRQDVDAGGWRIAALYGVNTLGAALGCFLTDFALVPFAGLGGAQLAAALLNVVAGAGALVLATRPEPAADRRQARRSAAGRIGPEALAADAAEPRGGPPGAVAATSLALALSGFAAMGMEILWFRHFAALLGGFRAVFSLLLTVVLIGIGVGSLMGGALQRRTRQPAVGLMVVQALFVAASLAGLAAADAKSIDLPLDPTHQAAARGAIETMSGWSGTLAELWFNARPILLEVGAAALLMGFSFPLANAIVQRTERFVGRRAGALYLANTAGAVCGSLTTGFLLLPRLGMQGSATVLTVAAGLAVVPLYVAGRPWPRIDGVRSADRQTATTAGAAAGALAASLLVAGAALGLWVRLPPDYLIARALAGSTDNERVLAVREGLTEIIAVTEAPGARRLLTNGHSMSSTLPLAQRYMRALAHIPLLSIDNPETVLVIGFGVGNTTHAVSLHPSIRRVEVADLSRDILAHARYFSDANRDVLSDPRVAVYVNDGRHHLQMQPTASYDLVALEPPPPAYAGMAALYSREFYALARSRLKPKGYLSQWLPVYQLPAAGTLAMIRAFIDVFPEAVLISGAEADLALLGVNDSRIEIDPARLARALSIAPAVQADLGRVDLGSGREIVGTFIGSAETLQNATRGLAPVTDDRPIQEYGVKSLLNTGEGVPASVVDLTQVGAWCPTCFADGSPVPLVEGLDTYLALLRQAYLAPPAEAGRARAAAEQPGRIVAGSAYLGAIVPESAALHNLLGIALAGKGRLDDAVAEFREALRLEPDSADTNWHLGVALASQGERDEAMESLGRSVELDADNTRARYDLASLLLSARRIDEAIDQFRATLRLDPELIEAHHGLGVALASQGRLDEAIGEFQAALRLRPGFADAERNLALAIERRRQLAAPQP